jgi:IrrE N-terminal-like domain
LKNSFLRLHTAEDIDAQVEKILRGLGSPPPPLTLDDVRALLKLDRHYYSSRDTGAVREVASRIYVAGKQILSNPMLLWEAIRKADLKALYVPDRRRILIDADQPKLKHRWNEAHEIGHSVIPWHKATMLGDDKTSLSQACYEHTEAEANYAAGRLLFLRDRFIEEVNDLSPTIISIKEVKRTYGNTLTSTFWRLIESREDTIFGAISCHPKLLSPQFDSTNPLRYFIRSRTFAQQFSLISESEVWSHMQTYCTRARGGPLGQAEIVLLDDNGQRHLFSLETFFNSHEALTLGVYIRPLSVVVSVVS